MTERTYTAAEVAELKAQIIKEALCGTAENAGTLTSGAIHHTAKVVLPIEETPLLPDEMWNHLTPERQAQVRKWFQLATKYLQGILDEDHTAKQLKAQTAAVLEKAAALMDTHIDYPGDREEEISNAIFAYARNEILALIPTDHAAALAERERLARERLEIQLAGCGVAALGWARGEQIAGPNDWGWSPAYVDTVKLRRAFEKLAGGKSPDQILGEPNEMTAALRAEGAKP